MVDAINSRAARGRLDLGRVRPMVPRAAEAIGTAARVTDPVVRLATAYEETGPRRLPKALEALKELQRKAAFAQFGLHVADAMISDRPARPAIDAIFKAAEIAIGMTTGLAKFHPLLAALDLYCAALKLSVGLLENQATFDRLLAERRERIDALEALARRAADELTPGLLAALQDAYVAAGGFVSFAYRGVLERAASPGARLSPGELIDTVRALQEVAAAARIFADARAVARAEVELRVVTVGLAATQIVRLGRRFDAHIETLGKRPTIGNRFSAAQANLLRTMEEGTSGLDHGFMNTDERALHAFERVLLRGRSLVTEMVGIERRFEALPAFVLARRIRSQGISPR